MRLTPMNSSVTSSPSPAPGPVRLAQAREEPRHTNKEFVSCFFSPWHIPTYQTLESTNTNKCISKTVTTPDQVAPPGHPCERQFTRNYTERIDHRAVATLSAVVEHLEEEE
ncbi:hypothetical protein B7463_g11223, partial [Scytalidium lignicola]